jgi:hypothetical protein
MYVALVIERPVQWRPGRYRSSIVSRWWWLWFAIKVVHVDELTYTTTAYDWRDA